MGTGQTAAADETAVAPGRVAWSRVAGLVALCVGVFALRVPFLGVPMITDEGGYAYWAGIWTREHQMYRDFAFSRPQGIIVAYQIILATLGGSVEALRIAAALVTCATACLLWLFARRFFSERAAWISAALFALFSTAPRIEGFTANAELFTLAPLVLNAHLVWTRRWFAAGLATALAFQLKPSGVEGCVLIALWIVLGWRSWRDALLATARSLAGFALGLVPCLVHGWWVGWAHFWHGMVTMRGQYFSPEVVSLAGQLQRIEAAFVDTVSSWAVPAVLFALALVRLPSVQRRFCLAWLLAAIAGMQIGFWWDWHFLMQIVPPLCFAAGSGVLALLNAHAQMRARIAWAAALALALLWFVARDGWLWALDPYRISWEVYHRPGYVVAEQLSAYVAKTTAPDDLLYIAFGQAEIYHLSGRRPAVPTQLYYWHARYLDSEWAKAVQAIEQRVPALVIWVQPPPPNRMSAERFAQLVLRGYQPDRKFSSVMVFRRK